VAVYSEADRESLHVRFADDDVCIGPAPSRLSYLRIPNLIAAAEVTGADAIHPGYGFLAENAEFADTCRASNIVFIGPTGDQIRQMGDKATARRLASESGIPTVPGSDGVLADVEQALAVAGMIGLPVIIKATAGGGGKGMRIVRDPTELSDILKIASHEAERAFADGTLYLERYIENPRHVEVQIVADRRGGIVHLGERDCTVQQNHQKLVEESPSPVVTPELRARMGDDAVRLLRGLGYSGAGTVEFLVKDGRHYFMEVNARVQVEHPVSELVTGIDIIRQQLVAAGGDPLEVDQAGVRLGGWAMECRINARTAGRVDEFFAPGGFGVRLDTFLHPGAVVPPHYDHLVAKLIVSGRDRTEAIARMIRALDELVIGGIQTNREMQRRIVAHPIFRKGTYGTGFIAEAFKEGAV
jgi:acetyl-CoA carboxylase biotin carboxylase subunit